MKKINYLNKEEDSGTGIPLFHCILICIKFNLNIKSNIIFILYLQYGLYGSFLGCFVYIFLGSCKDVPVGPSAIVALLTFQVAHGSWQKSVLLCLMCGIVEMLMGLFGLGFLIDFVSGPVSSGFTSAVSLIILTSQVKNILGISAKGTTFVEIWTEIIHNIKDIRASDTILGITCIVVLLIMRVSRNIYIT